MTFNIILVGLNYEHYRYTIKEPLETTTPPPGCNPPHGWNKTKYYENVNLGSEYVDEYIMNEEYWTERCRYEVVTQEEFNEMEKNFKWWAWISVICLIALTLLSPGFYKKLEKVKQAMKELY